MLTNSINFKVRPLGEDTSKEALSELGQKERDNMFYGDSIEKKEFEKNQAEYKRLKRARTTQLKQEKHEAKLMQLKQENMLRRGEGSEEKRIRSDAAGKENEVLKPFLRTYHNVDENITAVRNKLCPYQLVHEGGQFRMENPTVSTIDDYFLSSSDDIDNDCR